MTTPTDAIAIMNARAQEDARGYDRDQRLIAQLRAQLAGQRNELLSQVINAAPCECSPAAPVECAVCQFMVEVARMKREPEKATAPVVLSEEEKEAMKCAEIHEGKCVLPQGKGRKDCPDYHRQVLADLVRRLIPGA